MSDLRLSLGLPSFGSFYPRGSESVLVEHARLAEEAGVDRVVLTDHVLMGPHPERYPYGRFPVPPDSPWLEPLTTLAAIAGATSRLRLATGILIVPVRPAPLLAKTAATLDVVSGGRLDLGVGTGWQREELEAFGIDFGKRGRVLTDTVAACRVLWRDSPATFESETTSFSDVYCEPKPIQEGGPPVWFSGNLYDRNVERIVTLGDGWIPTPGSSHDDVAAGRELLDAELRSRGRDPRALRVQGWIPPLRSGEGEPDLAASLVEALPTLTASGATDVYLNLMSFARDPAEVPAFLERLGGAWTTARDTAARDTA